MTSIVLSQSTQDKINIAITAGPGANNQNYFAAYNAINSEINANGGFDPGTANWFAKAGQINTQAFSSSAVGTYVWNYTIAAARAEGTTLTTGDTQGGSNKIAATVFAQLQDSGFRFSDNPADPINFAPKTISPMFFRPRFNAMPIPSLPMIGFVALFCISALLTSFPLSAQSLGVVDFYGCWRHDSARKIGEKRGGFSVLCLRANRTAHYISIAAGGGGDEELEWEFIPNNSLVIDGQTCLLQPGSNRAQLFLTRCLFMGVWVRQCTRMSEDGAGCLK
jgi:hypothetical protein